MPTKINYDIERKEIIVYLIYDMTKDEIIKEIGFFPEPYQCIKINDNGLWGVIVRKEKNL